MSSTTPTPESPISVTPNPKSTHVYLNYPFGSNCHKGSVGRMTFRSTALRVPNVRRWDVLGTRLYEGHRWGRILSLRQLHIA